MTSSYERGGILATLFVLLGVGVFALLFAFYQIFIPKAISYDKTYFTIKRGASVRSIASSLEDNGLIRSDRAFLFYTKLTASGRRLRAGTFALSPNYSVANILGHLTQESGVARYVRVTIPEGVDYRQMDAILTDAKLVTGNAFEKYVKAKAKVEFQSSFSFLRDVPGNNIEGYLFPSTYYFTEHDTPKTMVQAMLTAFQKELVPIHKAAGSNYSLHDALTLASIVQKEARHVPEMPRIASVYTNRINKGMRLEADPTVIYGLGLSHKSRLYYKDLEKITPYNTYRKKGLPPTPIASPGVDALKAALNPEQTNFLFFVANRDGTHSFTKTYRDHLRVQREMRKR